MGSLCARMASSRSRVGPVRRNLSPPNNSNSHTLVWCGVTTTGSRTLRGSLLALGRQPILWA